MNNDRFQFRAWDTWKKKYRFIYFEGYYEDTVNFSEYLICQSRYVVEQCTCLKDKNGRLIYEGDIVKELIFGTELAVIEFGEKDGYLCFYPNWKTKVSTDWRKDLKWMCEKGLEVIGNIHQNPELLEGE